MLGSLCIAGIALHAFRFSISLPVKPTPEPSLKPFFLQNPSQQPSFKPTRNPTPYPFVFPTILPSIQIPSPSCTKNVLTNVEFNALYSIYNRTDGDSWKWHNKTSQPWDFFNLSSPLSNSDLSRPCADDWEGIYCEDVQFQCSITLLLLPLHDISGQIPTEVSSLSYLKFLSFSFNQFSGQIPSQLSLLQNLSFLDLRVNHLSGTIPSQVFLLTNLKFLSLDHNHLQGNISTQIGSLTRLEHLWLFVNLLTGSLPSQMGSLVSIESLFLCCNMFTSTIPTALSTLPDVNSIELFQNHLTRGIPSEFGNTLSLTDLEFYYNFLTGTIPSDLAYLTNLQYLQLADNYLVGELPSSFGNFSSIYLISIQNNFLTGSLPSTLYRLSKIETIYLDHNYFEGIFPEYFGKLMMLQEIGLATNLFTGPLPSLSLGSLKNLSSFIAFQNFFTGTIPSVYGNMTSLVTISLYQNLLQGSIPTALRNLKILSFLDLDSNLMSGTLPSQLGQLSSLEELILSNNSFTGTLPPSIFSLDSLEVLSLNSNCFRGEIPTCNMVNYTHSLQVLDLSVLSSGASCRNNPFSIFRGTGFIPRNFMDNVGIPECLWMLPNLKVLYLAGNGLVGSIDFSNVNFTSSKLINLSLAFNRLTGSIPIELQSYGKFQVFDLFHNRISGTLSKSIKFPELSNGDFYNYRFSVNRLSGQLPHSKNLTQSSVLVESFLSGNLFNFKLSEVVSSTNPLIASEYQGSNQLNISIFFSGIFLFLYLILLWLLKFQNFNNVKIVRELLLWHSASLLNDHELLSQIDSKELLHSTLICDWLLCVVKYFRLLFPQLCFPAITFSWIIILILKLIPSLAQNFSTHRYQYAWIVTSAYFHGTTPVVLFSLLIFSSLLYILTSLNDKRPFFRPIFSYFRGIYKLFVFIFSPKTLGDSPDSFLRIFVSCSLFLLLNGAVALSVNAFYVKITLENVPHLSLYQFFLALFKIIWNSAFIPLSIRWIASFSGPSHNISDGFILWFGLSVSIFNIILAPCIVTLLTDNNCLLPLFKQQSLPGFTYSYDVCEVTILLGSFQFCQARKTIFVNALSSLPPFVYNFQCSSTLIVNYGPVLLYSTVVSGFILPFITIVLLILTDESINNTQTNYFPHWLIPYLHLAIPLIRPIEQIHFDSPHPSMHEQNSAISISKIYTNDNSIDTKRIMALQSALESFDGRVLLSSVHIVYRLLLFLTVLFTFGFSIPFLGMVVLCAVWIESSLWLILIGRRRHLARLAAENNMTSPTDLINPIIVSSLPLHPSPPLKFKDDGDGNKIQKLSNQENTPLGQSPPPKARPFSLKITSTLHQASEEQEEESKTEQLDGLIPHKSRAFSLNIASVATLEHLDQEKSKNQRGEEGPKKSPRPFSFRAQIPQISHIPSFRESEIEIPDVKFNPSANPQSSPLGNNNPTDAPPQADDGSSQSLHWTWKAIRNCMWAVVLVTELFWVFQFYDMIADDKGYQDGFSFLIISFTVFPILLYLFVKIVDSLQII